MLDDAVTRSSHLQDKSWPIQYEPIPIQEVATKKNVRLPRTTEDFKGDRILASQRQTHQECRNVCEDASERKHRYGIERNQSQFLDQSQRDDR